MPERINMDNVSPPSSTRRFLGYAVHVYTATGAVWALLTGVAIFHDRYALAFFWMTVAVFVDSTDGFLARRARVRETAPRIDGRKMDDIADYLNYTFLPMVMVWHAGWLPSPSWLWASVPLVASLMAFSNTGAKEDDNGFFVGFPSYWNVFAFYTALCFRHGGPYVVLAVALVLSVLSVVPVRFVYPTKAPRWRFGFVAGAVVWMFLCLWILLTYPQSPAWLVGVSMAYPALYVLSSIYLDASDRMRQARK
ncbi:MAG: phosphatidylcholine synthase [Phycisphaerae bacterium]|nr:phosphatidylcholine synthase [Phycisphaerae bacterium]